MSRCMKCGTELISNEETHTETCPKCGRKYITSTTDEFKKRTSSYTEVSSKTLNSVSVDPKESQPAKKIQLALIGMAICGALYIIFRACLLIQNITPAGYGILDTFSYLCAIVFIICLINYIVYKRLYEYHSSTIIVMQGEIERLEKEIENLKKNIK